MNFDSIYVLIGLIVAGYLAFLFIRGFVRAIYRSRKYGDVMYCEAVTICEKDHDGAFRPVKGLSRVADSNDRIEALLSDLKALKIAELEAKGVALPPLSGDADFSNGMQLTARRDGPPSLN